MSVMQRKLFANKEARAKLRDMGGIMSSFPELSGEVQRFQDGGGVGAPPVTYQQWLGMSRAERGALGLPVSALGGERYFNRFGVGLGRNDPQTGELLPDAVSMEEAAQGEFAPFEDGVPASGEGGGWGLRQMLYDLGTSVGFGPAMERARIERPEPRVAAPQQGEDSGEDADADADADAGGEAGMTTGVPLNEQGYQRIADLMPPAPDEGDEAADPDTLRSRAEARIELFRDLLGEDEPTARDRAMQFAMIGLAIAAGQSPNALTNIANGLLAGTQSMTEAEARRRDRDRELRASAVNSVFEELASQRQIESDRIDEMREGWQAQYDLAVQDAVANGITGVDDRHRFATNAANAWMRGRYPDLFLEQGQEPIGDTPANAVRVSTPAEVEALEPGTQFVWTDGNVYTRS